MVTCTLTKCYSRYTRILIYIGWTSFNRTKLCPPLLSCLLPYSTFNCTSKTTGWFTKGLKLINLLHANKVLLKVAHAFLYTLMDFFQSHQLCPTVAILPFSRTFNCTSKTTGWFTKGLSDPNLLTLTKCYSRHTHSYTWMDFFQSHQIEAVLSYFHIFQTVHWAGGSWAPVLNAPPNKVLLQGGAFLYTWMDFFQSHQTVPKAVAILPLPYSRTFNY
jgi:hypothetical protein